MSLRPRSIVASPRVSRPIRPSSDSNRQSLHRYSRTPLYSTGSHAAATQSLFVPQSSSTMPRPMHAASFFLKSALLCLTVLHPASLIAVTASTIYVDPVLGADVAGCGADTASTACLSVGYATSTIASYGGDTIVLALGTYTGPNNLGMTWDLKPLTIRCEDWGASGGCVFYQDQYYNLLVYTQLLYTFQFDISSWNAAAGAALSAQYNLTLPSMSKLVGLSFWNTDLPVAYYGSEDGSLLASLTLLNCSFINNTAFNSFYMFDISASTPTALAADGTIAYAFTLDNCTFVNNTYYAGVLAVNSVATLIQDCSFDSSAVVPSKSGEFLSLGLNSNVTFSRCVFRGMSSGIVELFGFYSPTTLYNWWNTAVVFSECVFRDTTISTSTPLFILYGSIVIVFTRCHFINNHNSVSYGGVMVLDYVVPPGSVLFDGCVFTNNSAQTGGVVAAGNVAPNMVLFHNCTFASNFATTGVGGVVQEVTLANLDFDNCTFVNNVALTSGGAVAASPQIGAPSGFTDAVFSFTNCVFIGNSAQQGGALYAAYALPLLLVSVSGCSFQQNMAESSGGAVYITMQTGAVALYNNEFVSNIADTGGAVYLITGTALTITNSTWRNNHALSFGGALYAENGAYATINASTLLSNTAESLGGAVYSRMTDLTFQSVSFVNNSAVQGGALYFVAARVLASVSACASAMRAVTFSGNVANKIGGAMYSANTVPTCPQLCGGVVNASWSYQQAIAETDRAAFLTPQCNFTGNSAGLGYGVNIGALLASVQMLSITPSLAAASIPIQPSNTSTSTVAAIQIYPGLPFGITALAVDMLGRLMDLSNGGYYGVLFSAQLMSIANGTLSPAPITGFTNLPIVDGMVTFSALAAFLPPMSAGLSYELWISSDPISTTVIVPVTIAPCPVDQGYVVVSTSPYTCGPRPIYLPGDQLSVSTSYSYVLFSVAVCVLGVWTSMFLIEQAIVSRSRVQSAKSSIKLQQMWPVWSTLAALCFGVVGVWCSQVIGLSIVQVGYSNDVLDIRLHASLLFSGLALLIVLPTACYWVMLTNDTYGNAGMDSADNMSWAARANQFRGNLIFRQMELSSDLQSTTRATSEPYSFSSGAESGNSEVELSQQVPLNGTSLADDNHQSDKRRSDTYFHRSTVEPKKLPASSRSRKNSVSTISQSTDDEEKQKAPAQPAILPTRLSQMSDCDNEPSGADASSTPAAPSYTVGQRATSKSRSRAHRPVEVLAMMKQQLVNWRVSGSILLLWVTFVVADLLACASVQPYSSTPTFNVGVMVVCLSCSLLVFVPAMLGYLFYFRAFRLGCVALLGLSRAIFFVPTLTGMTWKYCTAVSPSPWTSNADLFSSSSLNLVVLVVALLTCAACMVLNIKALKLSHHEMAATLYKMAQHINKQVRQNVQLKAKGKRLQTVIKLNSTLRPLAAVELLSKSSNAAAGSTEEPLELQPGKQLPLSELSNPLLVAALLLADDDIKSDLNDGLRECISQCSIDKTADGVAGSLKGTELLRSTGPRENFLSLQSSTQQLNDLRSAANNQPLPLSITLLRRFALLPSPNPNAPIGSHSAIALPTVDLLRVLRHPVCCELLKDYCVATHNGESPLFCCAVLQYREYAPGSMQQHLQAAVIYHTYVTDGSKHECNISSNMKAVIRERMLAWPRSSERQKNRVFDESWDEVVRLLQTNLWQGFTKTVAYKLCQLMLASESSSTLQREKAED